MADDALEIDVQVQDDPAETRRIACRRPTHGELDVAVLARIYGVFCAYQSKIRAAEDDPQPGAARQIGNYIAIAGEAADEMRLRVQKALGRICADGDVARLMDADGVLGVQRGIWFAEAILGAIAPPDRLPK